MNALKRHGRAATWLSATAIAVCLLLVAALPVYGAGFGPNKTIASSSSELAISGMSAEGNKIAVAWLEGSSELMYRVSTDKGHSFGSPVDVGHTDSGTVAVCNDTVAAVRVRFGAGEVTLNLYSLNGTPTETRTIASGRTLDYGTSLACVGVHQLATYWMELVNGNWRLKLAVVPLVDTTPAYEFDLGRAAYQRMFHVTAADGAVWVAWSRQHRVLVQRFNVADDADMTVTRGPMAIVSQVTEPPGASVGVAGDRVYVAFERPGDAVMRISNDGGLTFSKDKTLWDGTSAEPAGIFGFDVSENNVLAEIHLGPWCPGCIGSNRGIYSTDWGRHWTETPANVGGVSSAILVGVGPATRVAEYWDNRGSHDTFGDTARIRFHIGTP